MTDDDKPDDGEDDESEEEFFSDLGRQFAERALAPFRDAITESFKPLLDQLVPQLPQFVDARWMSQLNRSLSGFQFKLDGISQQFGELVRHELPDNWPEDAQLGDVEQLVLASRWAVVWVPREEIIAELRAAGDEDERRAVLARRRQDVVADLRACLAVTTNADLQAFVAATADAVEAVDAGHPSAAQALAASVLAATLRDALEYHTFSRARDALDVDWREQSYRLFRLGLVSGVVVDALNRFYPGDPVPEAYNRHATAHTVSAEQYTEVNALTALMLDVSLLRELHELLERGVVKWS